MAENQNYFEEKKEELREAEEILLEPQLNTQPTPQYKEEKAIKKLSNLVGLSLILMTVTAKLLQMIVLPLNFLPINKDTPISILSEPGVSQIYQIVFTIAVFTIPFIACYKLADYRISNLVSLKKTEKGLTLPLVVSGLAFCSFANIAGSYISNFFDIFGIDYDMGYSPVPKGVFGFVLSVLATAIFPALLEEFAIRGIVMGSLRKYGDAFALITSSVCFGVLHGNFDQMAFAFMVGLFLGFTVLKTNSLRTAIIIHCINNFTSVVLDYFPSSTPVHIKSIINITYMLATFVAAVYLMRNKNKDLFTIEKSGTLSAEKSKYKFFFLSGGIIVFIIYNLIQSTLRIF